MEQNFYLNVFTNITSKIINFLLFLETSKVLNSRINIKRMRVRYLRIRRAHITNGNSRERNVWKSCIENIYIYI